jgi:uncharacterized membrane protein
MYQIIVYIVIILTKYKFLKLIAKEKKEKNLKQMLQLGILPCNTIITLYNRILIFLLVTFLDRFFFSSTTHLLTPVFDQLPICKTDINHAK